MEAGLAWLVATTWNVPLEFCGAVYRPVLSIVPPTLSCTLQVTAVLVVPVTVAVKDCVVPCDKVMELGVTVTLMLGEEVGVEVEEREGAEPPPQPQKPITAAIARAIALGWNLTFGSNLVRPIARGHCMIFSSSRFLSRTFSSPPRLAQSGLSYHGGGLVCVCFPSDRAAF